MTETVATEPSFYASLDQADPVTAASVPVYNLLADSLNAIVTANASKTKGVDEIAADLIDTSTNPKVVALREKRDELSEQISKLVIDDAKAIKEAGGEPDLEAEKKALFAFSRVAGALKTFPDYQKVQPFLKAVLPSNVGRVSAASSNGSSTSGNDLTAVRAWARENGFPDVKDKGRMADEILDAYNKAHGK